MRYPIFLIAALLIAGSVYATDGPSDIVIISRTDTKQLPPPKDSLSGEMDYNLLPKLDIVIISNSDTNRIAPEEETPRLYGKMDDQLLRMLKKQLRDQGKSVKVAKSKADLAGQTRAYLLAVKIEEVEFGIWNPVGMNTNVKVSYVLEGKNGTVAARGAYQEHSGVGWKNCVKTISRKIADDVYNRLQAMKNK